MKIRYISIFPEIFTSFQENGLIKRGIERKILDLSFVNPRHFTDDVHRTIDDSIYGGGHGMLMKAPPILDSLAHIIRKDKLRKKDPNRSIIIPGPSTDIFTQQTAHALASQHTIIYICGRYEGIDHRVYQRCQTRYPQHAAVLSLGQFITLGGETPAMVMTEAITRLIPGVIKESMSWIDESYATAHDMTNLEYPQYTRPEEVKGMRVPDVLLSGHHKAIAAWKQDQTMYM